MITWSRQACAVILFAAIAGNGCSSKPSLAAHGSAPAGEHPPSSKGSTGSCKQILRLKQFAVIDTALQQDAMHFLAPADWKVESEVIWRFHPTLPATMSVTARSPSGIEEVRFLPNIVCVDGVREAAMQNAMIVGPDAVRFRPAKSARCVQRRRNTSGYRNVWANPNGEFILTDDVLFNPNRDLHRGSWDEIERRR